MVTNIFAYPAWSCILTSLKAWVVHFSTSKPAQYLLFPAQVPIIPDTSSHYLQSGRKLVGEFALDDVMSRQHKKTINRGSEVVKGRIFLRGWTFAKFLPLSFCSPEHLFLSILIPTSKGKSLKNPRCYIVQVLRDPVTANVPERLHPEESLHVHAAKVFAYPLAILTPNLCFPHHLSVLVPSRPRSGSYLRGCASTLAPSAGTRTKSHILPKSFSWFEYRFDITPLKTFEPPRKPASNMAILTTKYRKHIY